MILKFIVTTFVEVMCVGLIIYGFAREDKLIEIEERAEEKTALAGRNSKGRQK